MYGYSLANKVSPDADHFMNKESIAGIRISQAGHVPGKADVKRRFRGLPVGYGVAERRKFSGLSRCPPVAGVIVPDFVQREPRGEDDFSGMVAY